MQRDLTAQPPVGRSVWVAGLAVALFALALRSCFVIEQYDGDMELFAYMGKLVGQGGRIGIELIDNKLPMVGVLMWPFYKLIGGWWAGYALLSIAMAIATTVLIGHAAAIVYRSSRWPTITIAAAWLGFPLAVFAAFKLEHVQILTGALSGLAFVRCWKHRRGWDAFAVGLFAGLGTLAKPTSLSVLVGAAAAFAVWTQVPLRERIRLALWMLAGLSLPLIGTVLYLVGSGAIVGLPGLYEQIRQYNRNSVWVGGTIVAKFASLGLIVGGPLLIRLLGEGRRAEPRVGGSTMLLVFASVWMLTELSGVMMQGRMYGYHFLPMMVPAALLFGLIPRRPSAVTVVVAPLPVLIATAAWTWAVVLHTQPPSDRLAANDYVKSHAAPGDAVWMDNDARILVESDLKPGSRVPLAFIFSNDDDAPQKFSNLILADFDQRTPRWIVLPKDWRQRQELLRTCQPEFVYHPRRGDNLIKAWTDLAGYVESHYTRAARFGTMDVMERKPELQTAKAE